MEVTRIFAVHLEAALLCPSCVEPGLCGVCGGLSILLPLEEPELALADGDMYDVLVELRLLETLTLDPYAAARVVLDADNRDRDGRIRELVDSFADVCRRAASEQKGVVWL